MRRIILPRKCSHPPYPCRYTLIVESKRVCGPECPEWPRSADAPPTPLCEVVIVTSRGLSTGRPVEVFGVGHVERKPKESHSAERNGALQLKSYK